jgi:hypothetical protein
MTTTSSRLMAETLITLAEAARRLPPGRSGRHRSSSCVFRWLTHGLPGPDGRLVRLEGVRIGRPWFTSVEAIARWAERLTPLLDPEPVPVSRTPAQWKRANEIVTKELDKLDI